MYTKGNPYISFTLLVLMGLGCKASGNLARANHGRYREPHLYQTPVTSMFTDLGPLLGVQHDLAISLQLLKMAWTQQPHDVSLQQLKRWDAAGEEENPVTKAR
jgi:hypothetical protein